MIINKKLCLGKSKVNGTFSVVVKCIYTNGTSNGHGNLLDYTEVELWKCGDRMRFETSVVHTLNHEYIMWECCN